jgi:alpha-beta hydrolase superfamily lysophospholipase
MRTLSHWAACVALLLPVLFGFGSLHAAVAGETTMPPPYIDQVKPEFAQKYTYVEDGDYSKALNIPTYEWMPVAMPPKAIVLAIHGLTLHGRRFRVLARSLAVNGLGFVALDMRGFGRCHFDESKTFSATEDKTKVDHQKSYEDIVQLATLIKKKYPDIRLIAMGESLGCTFCVRLAAEHPELVKSVILSAPAAKVNKDMYAGRGQIIKGVEAAFKPHHEVDMSSFFTELVSRNPSVQSEMADDPMVRKHLPIGALLSTDEFVGKTEGWGKKTDRGLAVLILQGSNDGCVSAKHVTDLMNSMPSDDQSLAWRGKYGHLQLETAYMHPATMDAIAGWLIDHSAITQVRLKGLQQEIADLGGTLLDY